MLTANSRCTRVSDTWKQEALNTSSLSSDSHSFALPLDEEKDSVMRSLVQYAEAHATAPRNPGHRTVLFSICLDPSNGHFCRLDFPLVFHHSDLSREAHKFA